MSPRLCGWNSKNDDNSSFSYFTDKQAFATQTIIDFSSPRVPGIASAFLLFVFINNLVDTAIWGHFSRSGCHLPFEFISSPFWRLLKVREHRGLPPSTRVGKEIVCRGGSIVVEAFSGDAKRLKPSQGCFSMPSGKRCGRQFESHNLNSASLNCKCNLVAPATRPVMWALFIIQLTSSHDRQPTHMRPMKWKFHWKKSMSVTVDEGLREETVFLLFIVFVLYSIPFCRAQCDTEIGQRECEGDKHLMVHNHHHHLACFGNETW